MRRLILLLALLLTLPTLAGDRFSYVYSRPSGNDTISISMGNLEQVLKLKKRYSGEYLWARLEGREYVIRDAAMLGQVRAAFVPMEKLHAPKRALDAKKNPIERRAERLEDEIDDLTDRDEDDERLTAAEKDRLHVLRRDLREVNRELRVYEQQEEVLDQKEEALEKVFDAEIQRIVKLAVRNGVAERVR